MTGLMWNYPGSPALERLCRKFWDERQINRMQRGNTAAFRDIDPKLRVWTKIARSGYLTSYVSDGNNSLPLSRVVSREAALNIAKKIFKLEPK